MLELVNFTIPIGQDSCSLLAKDVAIVSRPQVEIVIQVAQVMTGTTLWTTLERRTTNRSVLKAGVKQQLAVIC